jgi:hypothetical protein
MQTTDEILEQCAKTDWWSNTGPSKTESSQDRGTNQGKKMMM